MRDTLDTWPPHLHAARNINIIAEEPDEVAAWLVLRMRWVPQPASWCEWRLPSAPCGSRS